MSEAVAAVPLIAAIARRIVAAADELTALDAAIGDADHGLNMRRGFLAVEAALADKAPASDAEALKLAGTTLVMTVGGASGPLYGTLFLTLGKELAAAGEAPDRARRAAILDAAVRAVAARGKAAAGDKTLLDVLMPVAAAYADGADAAAIRAAADAAAAATTPMKALRGRAAFLGERSVGHMDPGARSAALMVAAVCEALEPG
jgi:dihydroxyacetone kinase-like protein